MTEALMDGDFAVFFRNDHVTTLFKRNGQLYTLLTDQGFRDVGAVYVPREQTHGQTNAQTHERIG